MSHGKPKNKKQPVRMGSFWGIRCESGKRYSQIVNQKYHISMAALDPMSVKNDEDIVSLVVERGESKFLLCNLQKDSVLQVNLNLFFDKGEKVVFSLKGRGIVHLTGYLVKDGNDQSDISLQPKNLNDSIMLAKDKVIAVKSEPFKKNLSSQNDSWKVESRAEIASPTKTLFASSSKKTNEKLQTNIKGASEGDNWDVESKEDKNSPSPMKSNTSKKSLSISSPQKLTPQKKLFETSKEESEDSSDEDDDDEEEEETSDDEDAKQLQRFAQKRPISSLEDDSDEDDEDFEVDDSSDESDEDYELPVKKKLGKDVLSSKKLKTETSTPLAFKKSTSKKDTEIIDIDDESKNGDMDSSIGRTPMPKKKKESLQKSVLNDSKKGKLSKDEDTSDSDSDDETTNEKQPKQQLDKNKSASQLDTSGEAPSSEKKKKKKKKKAKANDSITANESNASLKDSANKANDGGDLSKAQYSKKLTGGVEYEDIRLGNGPIAKKGRLVFVYYTGKLKDNTVFDSKQPGKSKPFSFKLGTGQVIKGWDLAVEGMKVGGKRRIKVPPSMGYQNQRTGPIPPNSTLYFVVELKSVL